MLALALGCTDQPAATHTSGVPGGIEFAATKNLNQPVDLNALLAQPNSTNASPGAVLNLFRVGTWKPPGASWK